MKIYIFIILFIYLYTLIFYVKIIIFISTFALQAILSFENFIQITGPFK